MLNVAALTVSHLCRSKSIHTSMPESVSHSLKNQFTHVYTTHRIHDNTELNVKTQNEAKVKN